MLISNNYYVIYEFVIEDGSVFVFSDIFHLLVRTVWDHVRSL